MRLGLIIVVSVCSMTVGFAQQLEVQSNLSEPNKIDGASTSLGQQQIQAAGTYADPKSWGESTSPGLIHKDASGFFESRFSGSAQSGNKQFPPAGQNNEYWFWRGSHAGLYSDPKNWGDWSYPGAVHKGTDGYYESKFSGSASTGNHYFPPAGQDNNKWTWLGTHAGTYFDPKYWSEQTRPGAIHKGDSGFYESRFTGSAATGNKNYPPAGQDNGNWFWRGTHAGTFRDPKYWSDQTRPGAIHKGDSGFYESRFTGSAATANKYYPPAGQDNGNWFWRGAHAGTFRDPKSWREYTYIGAIHGAGTSNRFESKFNGVAGPTNYYPTNNQDNAWWKVKAVDCSVNILGAEPSRFAVKLKKVSGAQLDMASLVIEGTTRTSSLLPGLAPAHFSSWHLQGDSEVASAILTTDKGADAGSISVVLNKDGSFYALVESPEFRGTVRSDANGEQILTPEVAHDYLEPDTVALDEVAIANENVVLAGDPDVDCNGMNIVDVLVGFSQAAVTKLGGLTQASQFAQLQIESANVGLRNSQVENVRLRLVEVAVDPEDFPLTSNTLNRLSDLFGAEAQVTGADMIAGFAKQGSGGVVGRAHTPGYLSLQNVSSPTAYRHEVGHNVGGSHCNTAGSNNYKFGYNNGTSSTFLCGNKSPYYSTPRVSDSSGKPLGDVRTADMARLWQERAIGMSSYRKSISPVSGVIP